MNCPKCHTKIKDNSKYCKECGYKIIKDKLVKKTDYQKAYIGNLNKTKISIWTLIFGPFYLLYKKIWQYSIPLIILYIIVISYLKDSYSYFIIFIINILLSTKFKVIYNKHVNKKIKKINQDNKNPQDSLEACKTVEKNFNIVFLTLIVIIIIFLIAAIKSDKIAKPKKIEENNKNKYQTVIIEKLSYSIPSSLSTAKNSQTHHYYSIHENDGTCYISVDINKYGKYNTPEEYIYDIEKYDLYYSKSTIDKITINENKWIHHAIKQDTSYKDIYVIKHNDTIYEITYRSEKSENNSCLNIMTSTINTLSFKEE